MDSRIKTEMSVQRDMRGRGEDGRARSEGKPPLFLVRTIADEEKMPQHRLVFLLSRLTKEKRDKFTMNVFLIKFLFFLARTFFLLILKKIFKKEDNSLLPKLDLMLTVTGKKR